MKTVHLCDSLDFDSDLHGAFLLRASSFLPLAPHPLDVDKRNGAATGIINEVGEFLFSTTINLSKSRTARSLGAEVSIQKDVVCWFVPPPRFPLSPSLHRLADRLTLLCATFPPG